jgi:hypothetical protein
MFLLRTEDTVEPIQSYICSIITSTFLLIFSSFCLKSFNYDDRYTLLNCEKLIPASFKNSVYNGLDIRVQWRSVHVGN